MTEIPNTSIKFQTISKFQWSKSQTALAETVVFRSLVLGAWDLFVFWDLRFGFCILGFVICGGTDYLIVLVTSNAWRVPSGPEGIPMGRGVAAGRGVLGLTIYDFQFHHLGKFQITSIKSQTISKFQWPKIPTDLWPGTVDVSVIGYWYLEFGTSGSRYHFTTLNFTTWLNPGAARRQKKIPDA